MKVSKQLLEDSLILDVRTKEEFDQGHFEGALHIPLDQLEGRIEELKQSQKSIIAYCKSGYRSDVAMRFLVKNGIEAYNGINLETLSSLS